MDLSPGNDSLYTTLDTCRDEIRLLEITSVEPVVCKLSIVSLLDEPEFSALSYTWGDASVVPTTTLVTGFGLMPFVSTSQIFKRRTLRYR
jgi:hypothetical protein